MRIHHLVCAVGNWEIIGIMKALEDTEPCQAVGDEMIGVFKDGNIKK